MGAKSNKVCFFVSLLDSIFCWRLFFVFCFVPSIQKKYFLKNVAKCMWVSLPVTSCLLCICWKTMRKRVNVILVQLVEEELKKNLNRIWKQSPALCRFFRPFLTYHSFFYFPWNLRMILSHLCSQSFTELFGQTQNFQCYIPTFTK